MDVLLTVCLVLLFTCPSLAQVDQRYDEGFNSYTKNLVNYSLNRNQSIRSIAEAGRKILEDTSLGRTFGRPFKKMIQAFIPLAFQLGAASTWAVVAAIVGVKTLAVTLVILKLLLLAGAAKFGALFASKGHSHEHQTWTPQQKEIHLHIHNGGGHHEDHHTEEHSVPITSWGREEVQNPSESKLVNVVLDPYAAGPQTISTPYGHYMRIKPPHPVTQ
ncbi:unnamed protein product, partial [Brenthis ino]